MNSENNNIKILPSYEDLSRSMLDHFKKSIEQSLREKEKVNVAISGGSTPNKFYSMLPEEKIEWDRIHLFWADERCVPPDNPESNFGTAWNIFLNKITIPSENIHNIQGDNLPEMEIKRYGEDVLKHIDINKKSMDLIILGLGNDGHTASLFPGQDLLNTYKDICGIAKHPQTGQLRVTLTYQLICNSENIIFLVSGDDKKIILSEIINKKNKSLPASKINSQCGSNINWFTDINPG